MKINLSQSNQILVIMNETRHLIMRNLNSAMGCMFISIRLCRLSKQLKTSNGSSPRTEMLRMKTKVSKVAGEQTRIVNNTCNPYIIQFFLSIKCRFRMVPTTTIATHTAKSHLL